MSDLVPNSHKDLPGPRAKLQTAYNQKAKGAIVVLRQEMARTFQMLCQAPAGWSTAPCWVLNPTVKSWPRQPSLLFIFYLLFIYFYLMVGLEIQANQRCPCKDHPAMSDSRAAFYTFPKSHAAPRGKAGHSWCSFIKTTSAILLQSLGNEKVPCALFNILVITWI